MSSDPSVDLEKGITGLKDEEKGVTGLKEEEEKAVHKHKVTYAVRLLLVDAWAVLFFVSVMLAALSNYRQYHKWWIPVVMFSCTIINFWNCHRLKQPYIRHITSASAESDLSTTLLASSKK